jgi:hypothetical protein
VRVEVITLGGTGTFTYTDSLPGGPTSLTTATPGVAVGTSLTSVPAGAYTVSESGLPAGWFLTSLVCSGGGSNTTTSGVTASLTVDPAESIVCTFTNTKSIVAVKAGDFATIGFWQNKNGQALINSLNGGPTATKLGNWLAATFPALWGAGSTTNLAGQTNAQIAAYDITLFNTDKWTNQVLGGAIAAYVTSPTLAGGSYAGSYGFLLTTTGSGARLYNVGTYGTALGLVNNTSYTVQQLLLQANLRKQMGSAYYDLNTLNVIFSAINQTGDIK